jgi:hypothetical protein
MNSGPSVEKDPRFFGGAPPSENCAETTDRRIYLIVASDILVLTSSAGINGQKKKREANVRMCLARGCGVYFCAAFRRTINPILPLPFSKDTVESDPADAVRNTRKLLTLVLEV